MARRKILTDCKQNLKPIWLAETEEMPETWDELCKLAVNKLGYERVSEDLIKKGKTEVEYFYATNRLTNDRYFLHIKPIPQMWAIMKFLE